MGDLVLGRKRNEKIVIGKCGDVLDRPIIITLMDIQHGIVARIGVDAPRQIEVHRLEVAEAIERQNERLDRQ